MRFSFLKHIKSKFSPMGGGVTCAFLNVDNFFNYLRFVALTISKFYLTLQIVSILITNKARFVVANSIKALKATYLGGFSYFTNLITC